MTLLRTIELERLLHGLIRLVTVIETRNDGMVRVQDDELTSTWLPLVTPRAGQDTTWQPVDIGEQVVVLCPSGDFAQGLVIGSLYQQQFPAPSSELNEQRMQFKDGTVMSYDRSQHRYVLDIKGEQAALDIRSAGTLSITTQQQVQVHSEAQVTVDAKAIALNGGAPCVTTGHICHFTGKPHGDGSSTVTAGQ